MAEIFLSSSSEGPGHFTTGSSANYGSVTQEDETGMLQRSSVWIMLIRGAEEGNADLLHSRPWGSSLAVRFHSLKVRSDFTEEETGPGS